MALNRLKKGVVIAASGIVVTGTSFLSNSITGASSLNISGFSNLNSTTIRSTLNVSGNSSIRGAVTLSSTLNVSGSTNIEGLFVVNGSSNQSQIVSNSSSGLASMYFTTPTASAYLGLGSASFAGTNYAGNMFLQSPSNIVFNVNGNGGSVAPAMYIASSGNVGIGTTSPETKLQIDGNCHIKNTNSWSVTKVIATGTVHSAIYMATPAGTISSSNPEWCIGQKGAFQGPLSIWNYDGTTHNSNSLTLTTDGKLGISTNSPQTKIDINDSTNPKIYLTNPTSRSFLSSIPGCLDFGNDSGSNSIIRFMPNGTETMVIANNGNVGIGTSNPNSLLQVSGTTVINGNLGIGTTSPTVKLDARTINLNATNGTNISTKYHIMVEQGTGGTFTGTFGGFMEGGCNYGLNHYLALGTIGYNSGLSYQETMRISGTNNVGIGTTSPNTKLNIATGNGNFIALETNNSSNNKNQKLVFGCMNNDLTGTSAVSSYSFIDTWMENVAYNTLSINPNGGSVGIGTTAPQTKLHVDGGNIGINSKSEMTGRSSLFFYNNPYMTGGNIAAKTAIITEAINNYTQSILHLCVNGINDLTTSASVSDARLSVLTNGNVGIGTTSALSKLHVSGDMIVGNSTGTNSIFINDIPTARWRIGTGGYALNFYKHTGTTTSDFSSWSQKMILDQNGQLGVGTTTPISLLELNQTTYSKPLLIIDAGIGGETIGAPRGIGQPLMRLGKSSFSSTAGDYYGIAMGYAVNATDYSCTEIGTIITDKSGYETGDIVFSTRPNTTNVVATERMRINSNGTVGIGTTAPSSSYGGSIPNARLTILSGTAGSEGGTSRLSIGGDNKHYAAIEGAHTSGGATTIALMTSPGASVNSSNPLTRLFIDMNGNTGIGSTAPNSVLHLAKSVSAASDFSLMVSFENTVSGYHDWTIGPQILNNAAFFSIRGGNTDGFGSLSNNIFNINGNNGNIGIGNTNPSYKLHVTGDINFTGSLYQNGTLFVSGGGGSTTTTSSLTIGTAALPSANSAGTTTLVNYGNACLYRNRLIFSSGLTDWNHSIYNNYYNNDNEGQFDGTKMNVYDGLWVRVGNANGVVPRTALYINSSANTTVTSSLNIQNESNDTDSRYMMQNFMKPFTQFAGNGGAISNITYTTTSTSPVGTEVLQTSSYMWVNGPMIRLDRTKNYEVEFWMRRTVNGGTGGATYMIVAEFDSAGNNIGGDGAQWHYPINYPNPMNVTQSNMTLNTWYNYRYIVGPYGGSKDHASTACYISLGFITNYTTGTDTMQFTGFKIRPIPRYPSDALTVTNSGNVGIGTTAPSASLQVHGSGGMGAPLRLVNNSASAAEVGIAMYRNSDLTTPTAGDAWVFGIQSFGVGDRNFGIGCTGTNNVMTLLANGNVGIGTTTPTHKLHLGSGNDTLRIGATNFPGTAADTSTYGLERSRNQIVFSTYRDVLTDKIGAKIVGINKQTYTVVPSARNSIQSTDLAFFTVPVDSSNYDDTIERMRITDTGRVGIGTTDPVTTLHVYKGGGDILSRFEGNANNNSYVQVLNTSQAANSIAAFNLSCGANFWMWVNSPNRSDDGGVNTATIRNDSGDLRLQAYGATNGLHIKGTSGRVGIGTTSPSALVQISDTYASQSGYGTLLIDTPNSGGPGGSITVRNSAGGTGAFSSILFELDGSTSSFLSQTTPIAYNASNGMIYCQNTTNSSNASKFGFQLWNGTGEVEVMTILPSGNVGIGTTDPGGLLDVRGAVFGSSIQAISNGAYANGGYVTLMPAGASNTGYIEFRQANTTRMGYMGYASSTQLDLYAENGAALAIGVGGAWRMFINTSGNVGIGTTDPGSKFHIYTTSTSSDQFLINNLSGIQMAMWGTGSVFHMDTYNTSTGGRPPLVLNTSGGSVGINTPNPTVPLQVGTAQSGSAWGSIYTSSSGSNYIVSNDGTRTVFMGCDSNGGIVGTHNNYDFVIRSNNTERLRVYASGVVDIKGNTGGGNWGATYATANGTLVIGRNDTNYGGASGATGNVAGLVMECLNNTEIGIHDAGERFVSFMYYSGNIFYVGRDAGWGPTSTHFATDMTCAGDISAFSSASDIRLKTNINKLNSSLDIINHLNPVTFNWKDDIYNKEYRGKDDVGFIAQEVEQVIPYAVGEFTVENNTYKKIKHERITPYVVKSIQELSNENNMMKQNIIDLMNENEKLKTENQTMKEQLSRLMAWATSQGMN